MSGIDFAQYSRFVIILVFVIALLMACAWVVRRFGLLGVAPLSQSKENLLNILGSVTLDPRRRLLAVAFGGRHYLVLLGPTGEQILETPVGLSNLAQGEALLQEPSFEKRRGL